ncbi:ABC transporter ATP-binding protein/permease [Ottowia sp.]|uniref:ABCB family ABC transporter ATP-binding protein/permease n=1 Tax=Ottowia sp. TaxID=1898956 RepID=UPI002B65CF93|nr:ABC transporter ATP-binding protein/permease [Ottowia sp.]HRN75263.1 ABC transporter ATP-binding protein/permease [Ottowia sp.]
MRGSRERSFRLPPPEAATGPRSDWQTLARLWPYLWQYKWRALFALAFVIGAKVANVGVPLLLKDLIDSMTIRPGDPAAVLVVPVGLLLAYGALRLMTSVFTELRELIFAKATQGASRRIALETFEHLHSLSLRFHLERQTGGMTRDIERGVRSIESLVSFSLYSIVPTLIEVAMVLAILARRFDPVFAWITLAALLSYIVFTVLLTEWRTQFRREANLHDSEAHSKAIDALINYETVKYFNNEGFEARRYDENLEQLRLARLKSQSSLSLLNSGQQLIIALSLVAILWRATQGVVDGVLTLGDLVMINAFMIQLYIPLGFLGTIYRQVKQNLTDLDRMFVLMDREREVADRPGAGPLRTNGPVDVRFEQVDFGYEPGRQILHEVSFEIPAGKTVAVVGPSGSGKSTLARLLYRFYDVGNWPPRSAAAHAALPPEGAAAGLGRPGAGGWPPRSAAAHAALPPEGVTAGLGRPGDGGGGDAGGRILIAGQDIRSVTQDSVRRAIGIVPQDTVLFNDTVAYNIRYGRPEASDAEVEQAARAAHIHDFIMSTPSGYQTMVGERGLKLSGGEKQRVAIARTLLKNPPVLIFDEATSALDSANERAIQAEIKSAAHGKTTLVIAHRLSTVVDAHEILVMEHGRIVERGTHLELLAAHGRYAGMWALQQSAQRLADAD